MTLTLLDETRTGENPVCRGLTWVDGENKVVAKFSDFPNSFGWPNLPSAQVFIEGKEIDIPLKSEESLDSCLIEMYRTLQDHGIKVLFPL